MYEKFLINIGACLNKKDISKTGGVVVLFEAWLQYCREQELNTKTIDTNKANYQNVFIAYFSIIWQFIRIVRRDFKNIPKAFFATNGYLGFVFLFFIIVDSVVRF